MKGTAPLGPTQRVPVVVAGTRVGTAVIRPHRLGIAEVGCHGSVGGRRAVVETGKSAEDQATEAVRELQIEPQIEAVVAPGEVFVQLPGRRVEPGGCTKHPGTHPAGKVVEYCIVALGGERDADNSHRDRREEERADGGVKDTVSDVEQILAQARFHQPRMEAPHRLKRLVVVLAQAGEDVGLESHDLSRVTVKRSVRMPSAAARRTGAWLELRSFPTAA